MTFRSTCSGQTFSCPEISPQITKELVNEGLPWGAAAQPGRGRGHLPQVGNRPQYPRSGRFQPFGVRCYPRKKQGAKSMGKKSLGRKLFSAFAGAVGPRNSRGLGLVAWMAAALVLVGGCGGTTSTSSDSPPVAVQAASSSSEGEKTAATAAPADSSPQPTSADTPSAERGPSLPGLPEGPLPPPAFPQSAPSISPRASAANPVVQVDTSLGSFQIELDRQKAPITVENFLGYVERGQYDQTHRPSGVSQSCSAYWAATVQGRPVPPGPPYLQRGPLAA